MLLVYPDLFKPFDVYTDASHSQLGAAICQNDKLIAFYSCKLNPAQTRYTTTECELLTIVETLKEFVTYYLVIEYAFSLMNKILPTKISTQNVLCDGVFSLKSLALSLYISREPQMLLLMR
jgi:RNase H-like domain found in reverse transcriptase